MRIPKIIKLGGHEITVVQRENVKNDKGELIRGYFCADDNEICLDRSLPKTLKEEVLIHECMHLIGSVYSLKLSEKQVELLAVGTLALLRQNKIVIK